MTAKPDKTRARKPSWLIHDLAWKIVLPTQSAMLIMRYLAKLVNDSGRCYASYATISRVNGGLSKSTISASLITMRDMGILTWRHGYGNKHVKGVANAYQFHIPVMQRLAAEQASSIIELADDSSKFDLPSSKFDQDSSKFDLPSSKFDNRTLTLYIQPSINIQPSTKEPSTESALECSSIGDGSPIPAGAEDNGLLQVPPASSIIEQGAQSCAKEQYLELEPENIASYDQRYKTCGAHGMQTYKTGAKTMPCGCPVVTVQ